MRITITDEAKALLEKYLKNNNTFLLTMNDGVNKYSNVGSCTSVLAFQIAIIDHDDPVYRVKLENDFKLPLYTGERELGMLGQGLKLKVRNNTFSLVSDEGVVDDAVMVNDLTQDKKSFNLKQI